MSDRDLRLLERAARQDPVAAERLRAERRRAGARFVVGDRVRVTNYEGDTTSCFVGAVGRIFGIYTLAYCVRLEHPLAVDADHPSPKLTWTLDDSELEPEPETPHVDADPELPPTLAAELGAAT